MPAMICAVQTFGDLINYHPHIHTVAPEGVFTKSGYFVHIPFVCRLRAVEIWQEKVFDFLVEEGRIDRETVAIIRSWRHSGFSVDNTVRIEADDQNRMQRLIEYISRCPFSLARMSVLPGMGRFSIGPLNRDVYPFRNRVTRNSISVFHGTMRYSPRSIFSQP